MNYTWIALIVVYIVLTHLIAHYIGTKRKIGYGKTVFWSIQLSPVIGFLIAKMSKPVDKQKSACNFYELE
jgi:L-cystine uptake protein TcyP (sodium:dicarboxylate symporter family)